MQEECRQLAVLRKYWLVTPCSCHRLLTSCCILEFTETGSKKKKIQRNITLVNVSSGPKINCWLFFWSEKGL